MNCKPGDLAMYIGLNDECRGAIVKVLRPTDAPATGKGTAPVPGVWWAIEPSINGNVWCADASLRPIRDPGDDARDQTLDWLPVPTLNEVEELGLAVHRLKAVERGLRKIREGA